MSKNDKRFPQRVMVWLCPRCGYGGMERGASGACQPPDDGKCVCGPLVPVMYVEEQEPSGLARHLKRAAENVRGHPAYKPVVSEEASSDECPREREDTMSDERDPDAAAKVLCAFIGDPSRWDRINDRAKDRYRMIAQHVVDAAEAGVADPLFMPLFDDCGIDFDIPSGR